MARSRDRSCLLLGGALFLMACGSSSKAGPSSSGGAGGNGATAGAGGGGRGAVAGAGGSATSSGGNPGGNAGAPGSAGAGAAGAGGAGASGAAGSGAAGSGAAGSGASGGGGRGAAACVPHDIDVPSAVLFGNVTVRGMSTTGLTGSANLYLRSASGDEALLGPTSLGQYGEIVLPGTYDLYYKLQTAGPALPGNKVARLQGGIVLGAGQQLMMDVDVPGTAVSGTITVNGTSGGSATQDRGTLRLRNATGDDALLGDTWSATYAAVVVPGTYDLYYVQDREGTGGPRSVPSNGAARLRSGIVIGSAPVTLDVDVPGTVVSGKITVNGAPAPAGSGFGGVRMKNAAGDDLPVASAGSAPAGAYSIMVIPGTYDLSYTYQNGTATTGVPSNLSAQLRTGVVVGTSPVTLDIDISATLVSGKITVDGAQVPQASGKGNLSLRTAAGDNAALGTTADGTYSRLVIPGTYDLYYAQATAGTGVPSNTAGKVRAGIVVAGSTMTLDLDVPTTPVTGTIKVNGAPLPPDDGTGSLNLRNAAGDNALLGTTAVQGAYSARVVAGTYDLTYVLSSGGKADSIVPYNQAAPLRSGIVVGATPLVLDVDVPTAQVSGTMSLGGMPFSLDGGSGNFILLNASGDRVSLGTTAYATYSRYVIPGTYELYYSVGTIGRSYGVPFNKLADLGCYTVP